MKEVFVSHRGALRPHSLLQAAEQSVLQTLVECVSRQLRQAGRHAGSARGFWKEDVAVI